LNATDYIHANAVPTASFEFSPASPDVFYPQVSFINNSVGASSWLWNFGDLNGSTSMDENPTFLFPDTACFTVTLIATSDSGCVDTTREIVCIKPVVTVYVPNAFTPNGDGVNDLFYPVCTGLVSGNYSFWIYDRWGQNVFFADRPLVGWDGKYADSRQDAQMDAYVWRLSCKDFDGRIITKSGRVTLVR
jgi:gliding motility-associated-like protein